jgi:hypothetical protein
MHPKQVRGRKSAVRKVCRVDLVHPAPSSRRARMTVVFKTGSNPAPDARSSAASQCYMGSSGI